MIYFPEHSYKNIYSRIETFFMTFSGYNKLLIC